MTVIIAMDKRRGKQIVAYRRLSKEHLMQIKTPNKLLNLPEKAKNSFFFINQEKRVVNGIVRSFLANALSHTTNGYNLKLLVQMYK